MQTAQVPLTWGADKQYVLDSYHGRKDNDVLVTQAVTRMTLKNTVLSKGSQTQKAAYSRTAFTQDMQGRQIREVRKQMSGRRGWGSGGCK